jgi:hypothetical protein
MGVTSTPNGHIVTMTDGSAFVTSPNVANDIIGALSTIVNAMANDMSKLTGLSPDDILRDYYDECECDMMNAAFNAVIRKHGHEPPKTLTRTVLESKMETQS